MIKHFFLLQDILTETAFKTVSLPNDLITCLLKMKNYRYLKYLYLDETQHKKLECNAEHLACLKFHITASVNSETFKLFYIVH